MKNFIIKTIAFITPILLLIISVNYFGDGARLFSNGYEKKIVDILSDGKFATNISNYDERILQREIIATLNPKSDILVLGSSRSMLIKQEFIPKNKVVYNSSVSSASIEDLIALYQMYKVKKNLPSQIILGIDPWMFNEHNGQKKWKSIDEYYNLFFGKENPKTNESKTLNIEKYKQLISFSYFQSSLKLIPNLIKGKSFPIPTEIEENETVTKLIDGSIKYGNKYRLRSREEVIQSAIQYTSTPIYSLGNYTKLSKKLTSEFISLLENIENQDIEVAFFLAPFHPIIYQEIAKDYPRILESEKFIIEYAKKESYPIIGSFNPDKISINDSFFYDGIHLKEEGVEKLIKENMNAQHWLKRQ